MILNWSINLLCIANNVLHVELGIKSTVQRKSQIFKVKKLKLKFAYVQAIKILEN